MHDHSAEGNEFFKCDFCGKPWADERPMVEGHQGALVCSQCLTLAYAEVVHLGGGLEGGTLKARNVQCKMCLEVRDEPAWSNPAGAGGMEGALICRRCIKQSAGVLERDPEHGWKRPAAPSGEALPPVESEDEE